MKYFVYIIQNNNSLRYIGQTSNLHERLLRHNTNRNKFTKGKDPWEIVIFTKCNSRCEACKLERKLKNFKNSDLAIEFLKKYNSQMVQSTPT